MKKEKKYKPLMFRPTSNTTVSEVPNETYTALKLRSPSSSPPHFPNAFSASLATTSRANKTRLEDSHICSRPGSGSTVIPNNFEYTDALYTMSYLSPPPLQHAVSPPR